MKRLPIIFLIFATIALITSCASLPDFFTTDPQLREEAEKKEQNAFDRLSKIGYSFSPEDNTTRKQLDSSKTTLNNLIDAFSAYLAEYGPDQRYGYNKDHYDSIKAKLEYEQEQLTAFKEYEQLYTAKQEELNTSLKSIYDSLVISFDAENYEEIGRLYSSFNNLYYYYEGGDLSALYNDAKRMKKESDIILWKESEKCKDLLNMINSKWLDLPLYVSSESLQQTLREAIESCDFSDAYIDVTTYINSMKLDITRILEDYTFEMEVKNGRLVISQVYSKSLTFYFSTNPYQIKRAFDLAFDQIQK